MMALTVPWMWWRGRTWSKWSEGLYFQARRREEAWAVRTDWGRRTPFYGFVSKKVEKIAG